MKEIYSNVHIIGAGLVGLVAGYSLSKVGYDITISEKNSSFNKNQNYHDNRTIAVSEGTKIFFEELGLWNDINKFAEPIDSIKIIDRNQTNKLNFDNLRRSSSLGYIVKNKLILQTLMEKLNSKKNVKILNNIQTNNINYDLDKINCFSSKCIIKSNLLIAADGKNSSVRNIFKTPFFKKNYNKKALVICFEHSKSHKNTAYEFFYENGPLAILPMQKEHNKNISSIVWTNNTSYLDQVYDLDNMVLSEIIQSKIGSVIGEIQQIKNKKLFPISAHINSKFYDKKLIYIGDSAHSIHPIAGQGWNLGMRDVKNLTSLSKNYKNLGIDLGTLKFCKEYHQKTFYDSYILYQVTDKLDAFFKSENWLISIMRNSGVNMLEKRKKIKNSISDFAMGF